MSTENTVGDYLFGAKSTEEHARLVESLYSEAKSIAELGEVPAGTTFLDIADVLIDTFSGYSGMGTIPATDLPILLSDALVQIADGNDNFTDDME